MPTIDIDNMIIESAEYLRFCALGFTRSNDAAEDLVQDTLYLAFRNKHGYMLNTNMKAWLYTIMRNIFINSYRKRKRQKFYYNVSLACYGDNNLDLTDPCCSDNSVKTKDLEILIQKLPGLFKTPFLLYVEGFKYIEIAKMTEEPVGTIKSRIYFARKLLKLSLDRS